LDKKYYVTTPIYYANADPHLGHAYTTIVADVRKRFYQMNDYETFFLTGTDEHGDKVARAALEKGVSPHEYASQISQKFRDILPRLNASNDRFIRTTDPEHRKVVRHILQKVYDSGDIYFSEYEGKYCVGCERFYKDTELVDEKCPDHQTRPELIKESNYFFKMSKYQEWMIDHINKNPDFIRPERYKNEALGFLREPLEDLCISRPKSRLKWGIELPFDSNYVTYVWFDALINYISGIDYLDGELFSKFWPVAEHIIGKDILKQHGIYWPTMLKAAGIEPFQHLSVHGYWLFEKGKMSKSLGNVITPLDLIDKYGLDAFRYYLIREMSFGLDSSFSEESFVSRYNADLANDLGNMVSRLTKMIKNSCNGIVPSPKKWTEPEEKLEKIAAESRQKLIESFDTLMMHQAADSAIHLVRSINRYLEETAPWFVAKQNDQDRLDTILFTASQNTVRAALYLLPVMPEKMLEVFNWFGISPKDQWHLDDEPLTPGLKTRIDKKPIFPRRKFKAKASSNQPKKSGKSQKKSQKTKPSVITYEDFAKIDLRVAVIRKAERVQGTDKLIRLQIEVGKEERQIVAGIAKSYDPDDLLGKQIVIVANLESANIRGVESKGMLLAANHGEKLTLLSPEQPIRSGAKVK